MRILITGASGFVGSHLVPFLSREHEVFISSPRNDSFPSVLEQPMSPKTDWTNRLRHIECVVHLAARVHVMKENSLDAISEYRESNVHMTLQLAKAAAEQGVKRFVYMSSVKAVADRSLIDPVTAFTEPNPSSPYGISKLEAEIELTKLSKQTGIELVILRPPLIYGPGVGGNMKSLLEFAESGIPAPLGSIENKRTLVSIWNLMDLVGDACVNSNASGGIALAGDPTSLSTGELVKLLRISLGMHPRVFAFPTQVLNLLAKLTGQTQRMRRLTESFTLLPGTTIPEWNWEPKITTKEGLFRFTTESEKLKNA